MEERTGNKKKGGSEGKVAVTVWESLMEGAGRRAREGVQSVLCGDNDLL